MARFSDFDTRRNRTIDVRTGYANGTHSAIVGRAADLGCGTGRAGAWLKRHGVRAIDGERWLELKPKWERFRGHPVAMVLAWRRAAG